MKKLLLLAITLLLPTVCLGRIGETMEECTARYGPMLKVENATGKFFSDYPQYCFNLNYVHIRIRFYKGRSAQEEFYSSDLADKRDEILASNNEKETGFKIVVDRSNENRLTITTLEFDRFMRKELGSGF
jgi:hypothetical protein